jgi:hypothetical protein
VRGEFDGEDFLGDRGRIGLLLFGPFTLATLGGGEPTLPWHVGLLDGALRVDAGQGV